MSKKKKIQNIAKDKEKEPEVDEVTCWVLYAHEEDDPNYKEIIQDRIQYAKDNGLCPRCYDNSGGDVKILLIDDELRKGRCPREGGIYKNPDGSWIF